MRSEFCISVVATYILGELPQLFHYPGYIPSQAQFSVISTQLHMHTEICHFWPIQQIFIIVPVGAYWWSLMYLKNKMGIFDTSEHISYNTTIIQPCAIAAALGI